MPYRKSLKNLKWPLVLSAKTLLFLHAAPGFCFWFRQITTAKPGFAGRSVARCPLFKKTSGGCQGGGLCRFLRKRACPKDTAAPHQGAWLRAQRGQERKKRTGQSPAFCGLGSPQGNAAWNPKKKATKAVQRLEPEAKRAPRRVSRLP
jgi:hypothetical protein